MIFEKIKEKIKANSGEKKQYKKKNFGLTKSVFLPFLIICTTAIAVSKQHGDIWKDNMETALSYYSNNNIMNEENRVFQEAYDEMSDFYYFLTDNKILSGVEYNDGKLINQEQADKMNKLYYAQEFYLFNKSMLAQNESFLYFNENNMDYLKIRIALNETLIIEPEQKINMIIYKNQLQKKMSPDFISYVDQYFHEKKVVEGKLSEQAGIKSGVYTFSGSVYNLLNNEEDQNVFNKDRFYMESRLFAHEMQPFLSELIEKGNEVKSYDKSYIEEMRGMFHGAVMPSKDEISYIKSSLNYKE